MSKDYEIYIDRLAENSIIMKGQINDVVFGLKGITDKLDTLIALKQVVIINRVFSRRSLSAFSLRSCSLSFRSASVRSQSCGSVGYSVGITPAPVVSSWLR